VQPVGAYNHMCVAPTYVPCVSVSIGVGVRALLFISHASLKMDHTCVFLGVDSMRAALRHWYPAGICRHHTPAHFSNTGDAGRSLVANAVRGAVFSRAAATDDVHRFGVCISVADTAMFT